MNGVDVCVEISQYFSNWSCGQFDLLLIFRFGLLRREAKDSDEGTFLEDDVGFLDDAAYDDLQVFFLFLLLLGTGFTLIILLLLPFGFVLFEGLLYLSDLGLSLAGLLLCVVLRRTLVLNLVHLIVIKFFLCDFLFRILLF